MRIMAPVLLLAFDTATPAVTVALHDGDSVIARYTEVDARRHGELLAPGIVRVLAEAGRDRTDLTDIAVGVGPGPFTGLRVGLVTAVSLGDALDLPVHGFCTLDVLAAQASAEGLGDPPGGRFAVATDARRKEVYWAAYQDRAPGPGGFADPVRTEGPEVDRPQAVAGEVAGLPVAGEGPAKYPEHFPRATGPLLPSAAVLAALAVTRLREGGELLPPHPLYLRRPDAVEPVGQKPVSSPSLR